LGTPLQLKHIVSLRLFLVVALLGTLLFYALHPRYLHRREYFDTKLNITNFNIENFSLIPSCRHPVAVYFASGKYGLRMHVYDMKTGRNPEMTHSNLEGSVKTFWDNKDGALYLIQRQIGTWRYVLMRIQVDDNLAFDYSLTPLFENPMFGELRDTTVTVREQLFYRPCCVDSLKEFTIQREEKALRIFYGPAIEDTLTHMDPRCLAQYKAVNDMALQLQSITGKPFTATDVYRIVQTFVRNDWYRRLYIEHNDEMKLDYGCCLILGRPDCNGDGDREFLIRLVGDRYLNNSLICWDPVTQSILWHRELAALPRLEFIADVNNDGCDEVGIGTYGPGNQLSPDWLDHPEVGTTFDSGFLLIDSDGQDHVWPNGNRFIKLGGYGFRTLAHYFPKTRSVLLSITTTMDLAEKKMLRLNLTSGAVDTLSIPYVNVCAAFWRDGDLHLWDKEQDNLREYVFSPEQKLIATHETECNFTPLLYDCSIIDVDDEPYTVVRPFSIFNKDLQVVYRQPSISLTQLQARADTLFFIDSAGYPNSGYLCWMSLKRNHELNPVAPLLIGFELLLLLIYWAVHIFVMSPIASGENGYIVLWNLFGRLFIWQPLGRAAIYRLPRYLAFDKRYFTAAIQGLSSEFSCVYERRLLFVRFYLYELEKVDELAVVQHVAHELKNRLHVARLSLDEDDEAARIALRESLRWSYNAARTISDFSRVSALSPKPTDLRDVIDDTLMGLSGHPRAECIQTLLPQTEVNASVDPRLLGMALRNVVDNALQATSGKEPVTLTLKLLGDEAVLTVSNPGNLTPETIDKILAGGWSSKPDGSGVGVSVARIIVQNHKGRFGFSSQDGFVTITIILPAVQEVS